MQEFTCQCFEEFEAHYGQAVAEDVLSRICESAYQRSHPPMKGVYLSDVHFHDVVNMTITGTLEHDGIEFNFEIDDGNRNGTEVVAFTTSALAPYRPPAPDTFTLVPCDGNLKENNPAMYDAYLESTRKDWFTELLRKYHYDAHFQPGCRIESHYAQAAKERGLRIVPDDSMVAERIKADLAARFKVPA